MRPSPPSAVRADPARGAPGRAALLRAPAAPHAAPAAPVRGRAAGMPLSLSERTRRAGAPGFRRHLRGPRPAPPQRTPVRGRAAEPRRATEPSHSAEPRRAAESLRVRPSPSRARASATGCSYRDNWCLQLSIRGMAQSAPSAWTAPPVSKSALGRWARKSEIGAGAKGRPAFG